MPTTLPTTLLSPAAHGTPPPPLAAPPDRTCWICFSTAAETPSHIRWTSPCACSGDTQWAHEPCLLTWIIRKQAEAAEEGNVVELVVDWDGDASVSQSGAPSGVVPGTVPGVVPDVVPGVVPGAGSPTATSPLEAPATATTAAETAAATGAAATNVAPEDATIPNDASTATARLERRVREMLWDSVGGAATPSARRGDRVFARCPQCHKAYHIQLPGMPWWQAATMDVIDYASWVGDMMVPYVTMVGTSYVLVVSSVTYGIHAVTTMCGAMDPLTVSVQRDVWPWRYWLGLFSTPYLLLMSRSPLFEGSLGALSTLSLAWTALKPQLAEDGLDFGGSTASVEAPGSLAALVRHRKMLVLGLLSFKRIYSMLYRAIGPMIIGRKARARRTRSVQTVDGATATATTAETPVTAADAPPPWDTNITDYADYDLNLNDGLSPPSAITGDATVTTGTVQITLVGAWRHFIETLMVPSIGHTTGTLLRHVCTTALAAQWVRDRRWSWASAMEKRVGRWDTFTWSLLGACSYFFVKDVARLVYKRYRRQQRSLMRIKDYPR